MNSINQVQQDLLGRMEQIKTAAEGPAIKPAQSFESHDASGGIAGAFEQVLHGVDNQQHRASQLAAAVDSGASDDLMGAMVESQKASVSFSALMQVRNKVTGAFEEIMRLPI